MFRERKSNTAAAAELDEGQVERDRIPSSQKRARGYPLKAIETEDRSEPIPAPAETPIPVNSPSEPPAETPAERQADAELAAAPKPKRRVRTLILTTIAVAVLAAGAWYGHYWWTTGRFIVSTDDAYVGAISSTIAAKVPGYITSVAVDDNYHVKKGDVIAQVDPGDYQLAVETAKDNVATEQATIARIGKQVTAQQAAVDQAKAQLASAQAGQTRTELELTRQQELATHQFASRQALELAQQDRDQAIAAVKSAEAGIEAAESNVDVLKAQQNEAAATLKQLQTALAKAERDLSFTTIRASFDGVIGNRAVQVGDYVDPGQRLATLVPLDAVYIDANFKETQLAELKPGQPVSITVDALPGRVIDGTVLSVAPASGSVFSLLPPDNATGNFTKIVQRVPVRIVVPLGVATQEVLRPGMSVVARVNTKTDAATTSTEKAAEATGSIALSSPTAEAHAAQQP